MVRRLDRLGAAGEQLDERVPVARLCVRPFAVGTRRRDADPVGPVDAPAELVTGRTLGLTRPRVAELQIASRKRTRATLRQSQAPLTRPRAMRLVGPLFGYGCRDALDGRSRHRTRRGELAGGV